MKNKPHHAKFTVRLLGDSALRLHFGDTGSVRVRAFCDWLARNPLPGICEWTPSANAVAVYYNPLRISPETLRRHLRRWQYRPETVPAAGPIIAVPVCYGGADGPDLDTVARTHDLTAERIIALHTEPTYEVTMLGFLPGFPYLAGLPAALHTPRLSIPRTSVPAGSVAIGGTQTGIYPLASPGGWHVIGRTETVLFDVNSDPPALLMPGDRVRFVPQVKG